VGFLQVREARDTLNATIAAQRATIVVRPLSPERLPDGPDGEKLWKVGMQFSNVGNTAPRQVAIRFLMGGKGPIKTATGTDAPKHPDWNIELIRAQPALPADIGPHDNTTLWTNGFSESSLMGDNNSRMFFYGTVVYDDVFKTTHTREFSFFTFRTGGQSCPSVLILKFLCTFCVGFECATAETVD
jgi:hypothetical protein